MTRNEKINKLYGAVQEWRGSYVAGTGKWIRQPRPAAEKRVVRWLEALGKGQSIMLLRTFTTYAQFDNWIKSL